MMSRYLSWIGLAALCLVLLSQVGQAVGQSSLDDVYVTAQFNASLRAGPDTSWERLAILPYGTTYRATGRTQDASWVQIAYEGELLTDAYPEATIDGVTYGWVKTSLTFWTGNLLGLPVDGVRTVNFVRGSLGLVLITPDTPIYTGIVGPQQRVDYPLEGPAYVEATAYYGEYPHIWVQFKIGPNFYWRSVLGGYQNLPNASMLVAGGRLELLVSRNISRLSNVHSDLRYRWTSLRNGQPVTCNDIAGDFSLIEFLDNDLTREPLYAAVEAALNEADEAVKRALERFREVCSEPETLVSAEDIVSALDDLEAAAQSLNLARLLHIALSSEENT